jgi:hypothetical protein
MTLSTEGTSNKGRVLMEELLLILTGIIDIDEWFDKNAIKI